MKRYTITVIVRAVLAVVVCLSLSGCVVAEELWMRKYRAMGGYPKQEREMKIRRVGDAEMRRNATSHPDLRR